MRAMSCAGIRVGVLVLALVQPVVAQQLRPDELRVLAVAEAALEAVSAEDLVAMTDLMIDEAVVFSISDQGGNARPSVRTRAEERGRSINRDIVERGFDAEVRIAGHLATVWLPYDLYIDGAWSHCGVDTFSLLRVDDEWRIVAMGWTIEQPPACREHPDGPPGG